MAYTYCVRKNIVQDEEKKAYTVAVEDALLE